MGGVERGRKGGLCQKELFVHTFVERSCSRVDSRLREPRFESCAAVVNLGLVDSLYIALVHSAV